MEVKTAAVVLAYKETKQKVTFSIKRKGMKKKKHIDESYDSTWQLAGLVIDTRKTKEIIDIR